MCVIFDFSSESSRPLSLRKSLTRGMICSVIIALSLAVIMKSSAYLTKLTLRFFHRGKSLLMSLSNPSKTMFMIEGEIIPPCGVPLLVGNIFPFSIYPALSHLFRMVLLKGMFFKVHSWLISSKQALISASNIHWAQFLRQRMLKHCAIASAQDLFSLNP